MYLETLSIKKFRSINDITLEFNKGVNIIIGENNAGKSAIIDALRICLSIGRQWRDIGIRNDEDFYIDTTEISDELEPIEFDLIFKIEDTQDRYYFNSMVFQDADNPDNQNIQIHFKYYLESNEKGNKVLRWSIWGGELEGQQIKPEEAQQIYFSYLAPLRNAEQELKPYARDNKVTSLFKEITKYLKNGEDEPEVVNLDMAKKIELAQKLEYVINDEDWTGLIKTGENSINEHLEKSDVNSKSSKINLRFLEYKYENIVKGVLTRKSVYSDEIIGDELFKQKYFDISQNGLGENNLILASAVLGDIENRRKEKIEHYYALLIEEPEAHLHPHKQNTFFNYLNQLQDFGAQIFITSHSPTITAKSKLDNLIILQKTPNNIASFTVIKSELDTKNKSYLRKFLDVTKSQLFFANGVILVEGISEALLLPVFAKILNASYDIDKNGVEIVNINGVAFEPFAKLFNSDSPNKRLNSRCSILTDNDKGQISPKHFIDTEQEITKVEAKKIHHILRGEEIIDSTNRIMNFNAEDEINLGDYQEKEVFVKQVLGERFNKISDRAKVAKELSTGNLRVELASNTFEYELMVADSFNCWLIRLIYMKMHPQTVFCSATSSIETKSHDLLSKLNANKDKSALAENLAYFLDNSAQIQERFKVPNYIERALNWIIIGV
jgi:putative ATP-dependent endonuclease of OLD family